MFPQYDFSFTANKQDINLYYMNVIVKDIRGNRSADLHLNPFTKLSE